jgi:O-antigen/teichoic acid export membrane protein
MSGTAISQGIILAATPFLTRLFLPEEFGILALYLAIVGTISVVSSWKYELAIMLPKEEEDAQALLFLSIIIAIITSFIVLLLIIFFKNYICRLTDKLDTFIWIVPLGVLITGLLQTFTAWGMRKEFFKSVSGARVIQSSTTVAGQLSLRFSKFSATGLIWGNFFGTLISLLVLIFHSIRKHTIQLKLLSKNSMLDNMKRYEKFPKYQSFSVLINSFSQHLPVILLIIFYSPEIAGFYSLTHRALNTPARLIGGSVRQVYYQRASKIFSEKKSILQILNKSTLNLARVSIIPYLFIGIFARKIFVVFFGAEWLTSGIYAQLLLIYIFTLTINPPAVMTLQILGLQKFSLNYEIVLAVFRFLSIYLGYQLFNSHFASIGLFSLVGVLFNFFLIVCIFHKVVKIQTE